MFILERFQLMENILRIWVYITVLKKNETMFFLKKPSLVIVAYLQNATL